MVSLNLQQRQALKLSDEEFKKKMDAERDVLAKGNFASHPVKLDSVLKTETESPKEATATVDDGDTDAAEGDSQSKLDVHLRETLRILKDALRFNPNPEYWAENTASSPASASIHKG